MVLVFVVWWHCGKNCWEIKIVWISGKEFLRTNKLSEMLLIWILLLRSGPNFWDINIVWISTVTTSKIFPWKNTGICDRTLVFSYIRHKKECIHLSYDLCIVLIFLDFSAQTHIKMPCDIHCIVASFELNGDKIWLYHEKQCLKCSKGQTSQASTTMLWNLY